MIEQYGSWVLMIGNLTAMILVGRKLWWAWVLGFFTEVLWSVYGYITGQYGFLVLAPVFATIYIVNAYKWKKHLSQEEEVML